MAETRSDEPVALITGGTGGLGSVVSRMFAQAGWQVVLTDLDPESLPRHTERLRAGETPRAIIRQRVDVTDPEQAARLVALALEHHGRVDALLNLVGGFTAGTKLADMPDLGPWEKMWRLNLLSAVVMCRAVIPAMRAQGRGRIVNVGSRHAERPAAKATAYGASKAALVNFTQALAQEEKGAGINVNAVLPGTIDTPANRQAMPNADFSKWVTPAQLGEVFLFLCSEAAQAITGAAIPVYNRS